MHNRGFKMVQSKARGLSPTLALLGLPMMLISTSVMGYGYGMHPMPPMPPAPPGMMSYGMPGQPAYRAPMAYGGYGQAPASTAYGYGQAPASTAYGYGYSQPAKTAESAREASSTADSTQVSIAQMRFEPAVITVKAGDTVTWRNSASIPHTVTAKGKGPSSGTLRTSQAFSHTFDKDGTYNYYCAIHPSMTGKVIVQ